MPAFFWQFWVLLGVAMLCSSWGFKKYIWFISIGYGFAIAGIGVADFFLFGKMDAGNIICNVLFIIYGCRLGGYLLFRELKLASYNKNMKGEIKDGSDYSFGMLIALWISCAFLYLCETAPVFYRMKNGIPSTTITYIGAFIMLCGICLEAGSDFQKASLKKKNPNRWCDTGLFKIVRCPNYLGEVLLWTGTFISGCTALRGAGQWIIALLGYLGIIYIMWSGCRRLELRQAKRYGDNHEYQEYVKKTPILLPLVPIYSVAKYKWLVG